ncbi:MAG: hypothetical protein IJI26_02675 [Clostridia bacterium]|nr:hypothetical protein [Clostridia bacterium]
MVSIFLPSEGMKQRINVEANANAGPVAEGQPLVPQAAQQVEQAAPEPVQEAAAEEVVVEEEPASEAPAEEAPAEAEAPAEESTGEAVG